MLLATLLTEFITRQWLVNSSFIERKDRKSINPSNIQTGLALSVNIGVMSFGAIVPLNIPLSRSS